MICSQLAGQKAGTPELDALSLVVTWRRDGWRWWRWWRCYTPELQRVVITTASRERRATKKAGSVANHSQGREGGREGRTEGEATKLPAPPTTLKGCRGGTECESRGEGPDLGLWGELKAQGDNCPQLPLSSHETVRLTR